MSLPKEDTFKKEQVYKSIYKLQIQVYKNSMQTYIS